MTDTLDSLPPDLRQKVLQSREFFRIAKEVSDSIQASIAEIEGLSIAFSHGEAVISGIANNQATVSAAMRIAAQHSEVSHVSNMLRVAEA